MDRMGQSSPRAAMIYVHGADARQHEIADTLSKLARQELQPSAKAPTGRPRGKRSGTQRARKGSVPLDGDSRAAGLGVWVVGLGGLEPPTSSLSALDIPRGDARSGRKSAVADPAHGVGGVGQPGQEALEPVDPLAQVVAEQLAPGGEGRWCPRWRGRGGWSAPRPPAQRGRTREHDAPQHPSAPNRGPGYGQGSGQGCHRRFAPARCAIVRQQRL
jgi:hypothetical protein